MERRYALPRIVAGVSSGAGSPTLQRYRRWSRPARLPSGYWARHLRLPFASRGLSELLREPDQLLLEGGGAGQKKNTLGKKKKKKKKGRPPPVPAAGHSVLPSLCVARSRPEVSLRWPLRPTCLAGGKPTPGPARRSPPPRALPTFRSAQAVWSSRDRSLPPGGARPEPEGPSEIPGEAPAGCLEPRTPRARDRGALGDTSAWTAWALGRLLSCRAPPPMATRLSPLRDRFGVEVALAAFFAAPRYRAGGDRPPPAAGAAHRRRPATATSPSFAQQAWFLPARSPRAPCTKNCPSPSFPGPPGAGGARRARRRRSPPADSLRTTFTRSAPSRAGRVSPGVHLR